MPPFSETHDSHSELELRPSLVPSPIVQSAWLMVARLFHSRSFDHWGFWTLLTKVVAIRDTAKANRKGVYFFV